MITKRIIILNIILFCCITLAAQNVSIQRIGDTDFRVYEVKKKDNIYSICNALNVSKSDLLRNNPGIAEGVKPGDKIFVPIEGAVSVSAATDQKPAVVHEVKKDETLYGISKMYNVSPEEIIESNPDIESGVTAGNEITIPQKSEIDEEAQSSYNSQDSTITYIIKADDTLPTILANFRTSPESIFTLNPNMTIGDFKDGATIRIKPNISDEYVNGADTKFVMYETRKGDTFASIATKFNVSIQSLHQANPSVKAIKNKMTIYVPCFDGATTVEDAVADIRDIYDSLQVAKKEQQLVISIILPIMADVQTASKQALLYTEFYKGFLLALNDNKNKIERNLEVVLIDSSDQEFNIHSQATLSKLQESDFIIAPDDNALMENMAKTLAQNPNSLIVNPFLVKSDLSDKYPNIYQINTPHEIMMDKAAEYFIDKYADDDVIFLSVGNLPEKDNMGAFRAAITKVKGESHIININMEIFSVEEFMGLINVEKSYVIIPTNGTKNFVAKIKHGLYEIKADQPELELSIFSYPEWLTYENEYLDMYKDFNTTIYSRFYPEKSSEIYKTFNDNYIATYGVDLINAAPVFGTLGYDIASAIIADFKNNGNEYYVGLQNLFSPERKDGAGLYNSNIFIINYDKTGVKRIVK